VKPAPKPLEIGETFEARFPGTPMPVRVTTLRVALSEDQQPVTWSRPGGDGRHGFHAIGSYVDPEGTTRIAVAYVASGRRAMSDDVVWFENTGHASSGRWRVWQERMGHNSLLALHGPDGAMLAVRHVEGIQRTRPIAFGGDALLLVERAPSARLDQPTMYEVFGVVGDAIASLLEVEASGVALDVQPAALVVRSVPELSAACTPNDLVGAGCAVAERTYAWKDGAFVRGPDVARLWKLVDTKQPAALPLAKPRTPVIENEIDLATP
jgi:hypothetical protein